MNQDMSQYLGVFLDEAMEQLSLLERECVELETASNPSELLQNLFRAAHTIKGASRAMGFMQIGDLTHEMENILDELRNDRLALSRQVVDALLTGTDALATLLEEVRASGSEPEGSRDEVAHAVDELKASLTGAAPAAPVAPQEAPEEAPTELPESPADADVVLVHVELKPDCAMKGCRALLLLQSIGEWADIVSTVPDTAKLEADQFETTFQILVSRATASADLPQRIASMADVQTAAYAEETEKAKTERVEKAKKEPVKTNAASSIGQTVRVDVSRLDKLLNLVGELVIDRTQLTTQLNLAKAQSDASNGLGALDEVLGRIERVTSELQEEVMKSRMLPIDGVFQRMPRMVRDLAQKVGKEITFTMEGGETELDRSVLEVIGDPLIHILRNALDHGIETPEDRLKVGKPAVGTITMSAKRDRNQILIEITDDGKGIDPAHLRKVAVKKGQLTQEAVDAMNDRDALNLIFAAGFSTAKVVSDVSGRGVGMDIVRSNLERIGGRATIDSVVGSGSKITIELPLTLAIVRAVLVSSEECIYALPVSSVTEMIDLTRSGNGASRCTLAGQAAILLRGQTLPLVNLNDALEADRCAVEPVRNEGKAHAVIVRHETGQAALSVDALHGDQEVVIKPIGGMLGEIPGVAGASILGDGRVALIIDPARTLQGLFMKGQVAA